MKFRGGVGTGEMVLGVAQPIEGFREPGQVKKVQGPRKDWEGSAGGTGS